ncbi:hypothetical protein DSO57_1033510 [Entomophthora muscae]|uniref:Uncharacterized protein n=1 Tax=Entomophthora muscae TaxID=34485 RepID=A0ACC2TZ41_9FUNG|nr:hypothetical protein DSO57_1033510 [Entomophthora muscae]
MIIPVSMPMVPENRACPDAKENIRDLLIDDLSKFLNYTTTESIPDQPATPISATPPKTGFVLPESLHAPSLAGKETESPIEAAKPEDKKTVKAPVKKPAAPKAVTLPPDEPIHPFFEAYKLSSLLSPTKDLEDLLMTLSIDQIKYMEGLLSRIKKRKNYHLKRGNPIEPSLPFTPLRVVSEPEIPLDLSLPPKKLPRLESEGSALGELPTPSLSTSNTSPSCSQTLPGGMIDYSTDNISIKENGEIWMKLKAKDSNFSHQIRVDVDPSHTEQDSMAPEFIAANSLLPTATTQTDKDINLLGLRLAFLNPLVLANNKSLLQEAVSSFQIHFPGMFSFQLEGFNPNSLLSSSSQPLPENNLSVLSQAMVVNVQVNGISTSLFLRADLDSVDLNNLDEDFKRENCIYPRAFEQSSGVSIEDDPKLQLESIFNEWGWKLAFLNPVDLAGNLPQLQCALDTYRNTFTPLPTRPSAMVALPTTLPPGSSLDLSSLMLDPQFLNMLIQ